MNPEIFEKLVDRYMQKGLVLRVSASFHGVGSEKKYELVRRGKLLKVLTPAELLEDARKRGCIPKKR